MNERYSKKQTRQIAEKLLSIIGAQSIKQPKKAMVVGLSGDLGTGKTTLTQELAMLLGVKETIQSPTFVIAKFYKTNNNSFKEMVHIDAYRIDNPKELDILGWQEMIEKPETLIVVEWPERIMNALPKDTKIFSLSHDGEYRHINHA